MEGVELLEHAPPADRRDIELRGLRNDLAGRLRVHPRELAALERSAVETLMERLATERAEHQQVVEQYQQQLRTLRQEMSRWEELARSDPLTKLPNRRAAHERLEREIQRGRRFGHQFAVFMLDIDHFKLVNDQHGHAKGDQLLVNFALHLAELLRSLDLAARWGGDEFLVLCPETDAAGAAQVAAKIDRIEIDCSVAVQGRTLRPRVSVGWAIAEPGDDLRSLLHHADSALYRAKAMHRRQDQEGAAKSRSA